MRILDAKEVQRPSDYQFHIELTVVEIQRLANWNRSMIQNHRMIDSPPQLLIDAIVNAIPESRE